MEADELTPKARLRSAMRAKLEKISAAVRAVESIELCERLKVQMPAAHAILFFAPLTDELDVWPLLEQSLALGCVCALPFFNAESKGYQAKVVENVGADIVTGKFGVREPAESCQDISLDRLDLVLVPGMAFDLQGNRLGRGRGFYDRLLAVTSGIKCGICYDHQLLAEAVPTDSHDTKVDFILTPRRTVRRSR